MLLRAARVMVCVHEVQLLPLMQQQAQQHAALLLLLLLLLSW
jgi:hypothetical protein